MSSARFHPSLLDAALMPHQRSASSALLVAEATPPTRIATRLDNIKDHRKVADLTKLHKQQITRVPPDKTDGLMEEASVQQNYGAE